MKTKRFLVLISAVASCFLLLSMQDFTDEQQDIIEHGVEIKIEEYILRQEKSCWDRAVTRAVVYVDSMVRAGALQSRIDPVVKPPRPDKPDKPLIKQLPDSLNHGILRNDQ